MSTTPPATAAQVRRRSGPPRPRARQAGVIGAALAVALAVAHLIAIRETQVSVGALIDGWSGITHFLSDAIPPDLTWDTVLKPGLLAAVTTFWIGLLGTTLSIPFTLALAVLGARTTTPNLTVYQVARSLMSFLRAVPTSSSHSSSSSPLSVPALSPACSPSCSTTPASWESSGPMSRRWTKTPVTALRTTGAKRPQVLAHAVLPTVVPQLIGLLIYRLDVNVRSSLVLGLIGAGGIGFLINKSIKLFQFNEMLTYILIVLALIVAVDQVSSAVRRRLAR